MSSGSHILKQLAYRQTLPLADKYLLLNIQHNLESNNRSKNLINKKRSSSMRH